MTTISPKPIPPTRESVEKKVRAAHAAIARMPAYTTKQEIEEDLEAAFKARKEGKFR